METTAVTNWLRFGGIGLCGEHFQRRGVDLPVTGRDDTSTRMRTVHSPKLVIMPPAPVMIGISRQHVVRLEPGLDEEVHMAGGEHGPRA